MAGFALLVMAGMLQAAEIGVVFLHAKGASPDAGTTSGLIDRMRKEGMEVVTPELPWSKGRGYDASYEDALGQVHEAVQALRAKGVKTVIVAGHSLGANGAIGYAANYDGVNGVVAIAPGHSPELRGFQKKLGDSVERARAMVDEGKGDEAGRFNDLNQGKTSAVKTTPLIYLSYFDPEGPAVMPSNVMGLKEGTALLWIVGEKDRMAKRGEGYAYGMAPANELNAYVVVPGGHKATPARGEQEIIAWIKRVAAARR
ncbi:MAG: alpha/beta hydrolase [Chromatiales bacterium]|nr:alpha/beta hydrolase [Chromatiales bacterium]